MFKKMLNYFFPILRYTSSIVGIRIFNMTSNFIGMVVISQLGQNESAAGALVTVFSNTLMLIAMSPLLAISIILSKYYGENRFCDMGVFLKNAIIISVGVGILASISLLLMPPLLLFLDQPTEIIPLIKKYFIGLSWGIVPSFVLVSLYQFCFSVNLGFIPLMWSIITFILVLIFGFSFTYGYLGFPGLGISGWSNAISLVNWIMLFVGLIYFYYKPSFSVYKIFDLEKIFNLHSIKDLFKIGLPITIQFSGELLAFAILNIMVGWLDASSLTIQQVIIQTGLLALMIPMGGSQACAILIAQAIGKGNVSGVKPIFFMGIAFVLFFMFLIAALYLFQPMKIIALYFDPNATSNVSMVSIAVVLLWIAAFSQVADAVRNLIIGMLRGMKDVWHPMWINIGILFILGIPCSYYLGIYKNKGLIGLNTGFLVAFSIGAITMFLRFSNKVSKIIKDPVK